MSSTPGDDLARDQNAPVFAAEEETVGTTRGAEVVHVTDVLRSDPQTELPQMQREIDPDQKELNELEFSALQFNAVLKPVTVTICIVVYLVTALGSESSPNRYGAIMVYNEQGSDSAGKKFGGALLNALMFIGLILVTTVIFVILYKYRCMKILYGWLMLSTGMLLGFFGGFVLRALLIRYEIAMDWITISFFLWNYTIVGVMSVFWHSPRRVQQVYLIIVSAILAYSLTILPEWSTWAILAAFAIYDIFAVLTPKGPLKVLVETAQERGDQIPGLIYQGTAYQVINLHTPRVPSIKLGLGDFIFYSVLVARGATLLDATTVLTTSLAVIMGLCLTLLLLGIYQKALPALPISIAFGMLFYFVTRDLLLPYVVALGTSGLYV